jgi:hypothetical protein
LLLVVHPASVRNGYRPGADRGLRTVYFKNQFAASGSDSAAPNSNVSPSSGKKAASRQSAPNRFRIDVGVIPAISPAMSSDCARLAYKVGREDVSFVSEGRAVDAALSLAGSHIDAVINKLSPNKEGVTGCRSQHDLFSRPRK